MLLRLIRIDPVFVWVWRFLAVSAVAALVPGKYALPLAAGLYSAMLGIALHGGGFQRRCVIYQLSLPLDSRTVWLSRLVCFNVLFWLPVLFQYRYGLRAVGVALALSILHAMLCAYSPQRDSAPGWWLFLSALGAIAAGLALQRDPQVWKAGLAAFGVLALYTGAWLRIPESFQTAAAQVSANRNPSRRRISSGWHLRNTPLLRAFLGWQPLIFLGLIPLQSMGVGDGEPPWGVLFIPMALFHIDSALAWLRHTPVTRSRVFAWAMGVPLSLHVGAFVWFAFHTRRGGPVSFDGRFLASAFIVSMFLLVVTVYLMLQTQALYQMLTKPQAIVAFGVLLTALISLLFPWISIPGTDKPLSPLARLPHLLANAMPQQPVLLWGFGIVSLIGAYRIMERLFVRAEPAQPVRKVEVMW